MLPYLYLKVSFYRDVIIMHMQLNNTVYCLLIAIITGKSCKDLRFFFRTNINVSLWIPGSFYASSSQWLMLTEIFDASHKQKADTIFESSITAKCKPFRILLFQLTKV